MNSQNYAPRCRGQLNALLPEAVRPRAIVHWAVHGTEGHDFDYSAKQAWNNCFITQPNLEKTMICWQLQWITSLIGADVGKPVTLYVTREVWRHRPWYSQNYTTLISHYVYMGDVTNMV